MKVVTDCIKKRMIEVDQAITGCNGQMKLYPDMKPEDMKEIKEERDDFVDMYYQLEISLEIIEAYWKNVPSGK